MSDKIRVVIVDDEFSARSTLEGFLLIEEYELISLESGVEFLEKIGKIDPDVILLDVMMPEMDGFKICRKLKADKSWQHIPIIMITALDGVRNLTEGIEAGADEFITKPVSGFELRARVRSMLRIKRQYDKLMKYQHQLEDIVQERTGELEKARDMLSKKSYDLNERVKELRCLYQISGLVENNKENNIHEILRGTVKLIPPAWQYPEITCGRIVLHNQEFKTENFRKTNWRQAEEIIVNDEKVGLIEVYYLQEMSKIDEGPFLKEERYLIRTIAERLGHIIERKEAEKILKENEKLFRSLFENNHSIMLLIDPSNARIVDANPAACEFYGYSKVELTKKKITEINTFSEEQVFREMNRAKTEKRNHFFFEHQLANGEIRDVEVYSGPIERYGKKLLYSIIHNITERKMAQEALKKNEQRLQNLSRHLQEIKEKERKNIAREIHDELGQALTALKFDLFWLGSKLEKKGEVQLWEKTESMSDLIVTTIKKMKTIITALRPQILDDLGLSAAIEWELQEFEKRTNIKFEFEVEPELTSFDKHQSLVIYRVFQEGITNVARHSQASKIIVNLGIEDGFLGVKIVDNGIGITKAQISSLKSFGIIGMQERLHYWEGELEIFGKENEGTTLIAKIPVKEGK